MPFKYCEVFIKYTISTDIEEIKKVLLKSKSSSESIIWQTSSSERKIFNIKNINIDDIRKIVRFEFNDNIKDLNRNALIYIKLAFRNTIFKGEIIKLVNNYIYVNIPEEFQLEELREFPRFEFNGNEDKFASLSIKTELVSNSNLNLKVKLLNISQQGMGMAVSYANGDLLKENSVQLKAIGNHEFTQPVNAKIVYDEHMSYKQNGKLVKCLKLGAKLDINISQELLQSFIRSVEGFDHSRIGFLGSSHDFENALHSQMESMYSQLKKSNNFFRNIEKRSSEISKFREEDYFPKHIKLVAQISCALAKLIGNDTKKVIQSLIYTAFTHDIAFLANRKLSLIQDQNHFEKIIDQLTPEEIDIYNSASKIAYDFAFYDNYAPKGVEKILIQVRELPNGLGVPNGIKANDFHPLAALFIVAHDLTNFIFERKNWNYHDYLLTYPKKFQGGVFDDIFNHLNHAREIA